jgi:hypothetical protein
MIAAKTGLRSRVDEEEEEQEEEEKTALTNLLALPA